MNALIWLAINSCLAIGQLQNFGSSSDPEEKKRGEKTIAQNDEMIRLNRRMLALSVIAIVIAILALLVSVIALVRSK